MNSSKLYSESAVYVLDHPDLHFENTPDYLLHYWLKIDREHHRSNDWENPLFHIFVLLEAFSRPSRQCTYTLVWVQNRFGDFRFFVEKEVQARGAGGHLPRPVPITDIRRYVCYRAAIQRIERLRNAAGKDSTEE